MLNPPKSAGPFLKLINCADKIWTAQLLFVHRENFHPILCIPHDPPSSESPDGFKSTVKIKNRTILAEKFGYIFTTWLIVIEQDKRGFRQDYFVKLTENDAKRLCFFVPGYAETWKWCFFSCNDISHTSGYSGYSEKYGGIVPLWADLVQKHHEHRYNMMIGLGDQVYLDEVFEHAPLLDAWTRLPDRKERETMACPQKLIEEVDKWAFFYYVRHFSQAYFEQALATIPYIFLMSDHDTYDGQGSYPPELENSPVLSKVRKVLQELFLLFQTIHDRKKIDGILSNNTFHSKTMNIKKKGKETKSPLHLSFVSQLGQHLGLVGLDTRFERTRDQVISKETYDDIFEQLYNLEESTTHVVVATEIPLIFPDLRYPEKVLQHVSDFKRSETFNRMFRGRSFHKILGFPFGEPLLLTDMIDHWNSTRHIEERNVFLHRLQDFSLEKSIRITFIGGDVHCAGVGRFATPANSVDKVRAYYENEMIVPLNAAKDHRLMYQIISSAIANIPPPWYIIKGYHFIDHSEKIRKRENTTDNNDLGHDQEKENNVDDMIKMETMETVENDKEGADIVYSTDIDTDNVTDARMLRFFMRDTKGKVFRKSAMKLMGKRNWTSCTMSSVDDSLFFELYVEMFTGAGKTVKYNIIVPALEI